LRSPALQGSIHAKYGVPGGAGRAMVTGGVLTVLYRVGYVVSYPFWISRRPAEAGAGPLICKIRFER